MLCDLFSMIFYISHNLEYRLWCYTNRVCLHGAKMEYELAYMKRNGANIELYYIKWIFTWLIARLLKQLFNTRRLYPVP